MQWLFTLRGAPFIGDGLNEEDRKICHRNPEYTKVPSFHGAAGVCLFQVQTCVPSPC